MRPGELQKYLRIGVISALMAVSVFVIGLMVNSSISEAVLVPATTQEKPKLPYEAGVFTRLEHPVDFTNSPVEKNVKRSLASYYSRRAYDGAPPSIPHKILDPTSWGGDACNSCHRDGGYVEQFKAWAPVTPHPDYLSCRQCHVPVEQKTVFRDTRFAGLKPAGIPKGRLPNSPPPIPHALDLRTNCVACHGGAAAVPELRTTHPERVNCRQCHAAINMAATGSVPAEFTRPAPEGAH